MRILLVYCHPDPKSYCAALRRTATAALRAAGHEVRELDLYAERFDPVLSRAEKRDYLTRGARNVARVAAYVRFLRQAQGWVAVFPTWYYGPPAMLKGWLERVWLPGVAFTLGAGRRARGALRDIRLFVGITTSGATRAWLKRIGDPGRALFTRALPPLYARDCRVEWLQLCDMDRATARQRAQFLARVRRRLSRISRTASAAR